MPRLTNSVFLVAVFAAARMAPQLLGPFVGAIADLMNRRKLMITARALEMVFASTLAVLISTGVLELWHLLVIGFLAAGTDLAGATGGRKGFSGVIKK